VPHLLWHRASIFSGFFWGIATFNRLFRLARGCRGPNPDHHAPPFNRLLRHTMGCWEPTLNRILKGPHSVASYDTKDLFLPGFSRVNFNKEYSELSKYLSYCLSQVSLCVSLYVFIFFLYLRHKKKIF
jgi:hypothetical protein